MSEVAGKVGGGAAEDTRGQHQTVTTPTHKTEGEATSLIEQVVCRENMLAAYRRVLRNKGAPGVDGITVDELKDWCNEHWPAVRQQLIEGTYKPKPVRRVEIPKAGGGVRTPGIPTVVDRMIQQALLQALSPIYEPTFSESSYGFRPGRGTHDAVQAAKGHIADGYRWVVDMDLEKFFDRVNHDVLMARLARRIEDKQVLRLIRRYLQAGMMEGGVVSPRAEGTPQGGPLSPLLSNILPDELDKELENRGHRFVRYSAKRLKEKLKPILRRGRGRSLRRVIEELKPILRGWAAYYKLSETRGVFEELDGWIRRKLRCILWRQWKKPKTRRPEPASTNHLPCGQVLDLVSLLDENKRFADLR